MTGVHLFWDNSNIFVPAKYAAEKREGPHAYHGVRMQFDNLFALARAGRKVARATCVGSVPPDLGAVWRRLRADTGVDIELFERGRDSGKEQGVDQCLQVHMLRAALDDEPSTAVLLTGDGAGFENGIGFHADLRRLVTHGWAIEVLSWDSACATSLRDFAEDHGVYVSLDSFFESVTFIQGGRRARPLSLTHRPTATPRHQIPSA